VAGLDNPQTNGIGGAVFWNAKVAGLQIPVVGHRGWIGRVEMLVAGIRRSGGDVEMIDMPAPRPLAEDEVLIQVRAAGVASWDEIVRTGGWDVGSRPPMALGVEAAGMVAAVGSAVIDWSPGDEVITHPLPLRDQGTWAPMLIAPAALLAPKPAGVSWEVAAVFPVPALTAEQVLDEALDVKTGDRLLVNGAGGVTGGLLVSLGSLCGAEVVATAGLHSQEQVRALGARHVIDYHDEDWPEQVLAITGDSGVSAAVNAAPGGAKDAIRAVTDGGRLATITSDPPAEERGITVSSVYVRPDGGQLRNLAQLLADGKLKVSVGSTYRLLDAADALATAVSGRAGGAVALTL
jgi:NADPH:quinone reductase-like Zn-dependent oxidoreductase